ncbi:MAG: hypothetical protein ABI461_09235 [Polyangiaceae bacterium]
MIGAFFCVSAAPLTFTCESTPPPNPKNASPALVATTATASGGCPSHIAHPNAVAMPLAPPVDWLVRETPAPAGETIECANLSRREWRISSKNGQIEPVLRSPQDAGDPLPFPFHPTKKDGAALNGTRHVHQVPEGFLVGFDAGEYGGALYLFSADGTMRKKLSDENVLGFADLRLGTIVLTGLAHLGMSVGHLLQITRNGSGVTATQWIDLGGATETFFVDSPESLLVLTTGALFRVTACGGVNQISRTNYDALYPTSMLVDDRGVIYVGMRQFIARWIPTADSYHEQWLTKSDCTLMVRDKFECKCRGGS